MSARARLAALGIVAPEPSPAPRLEVVPPPAPVRAALDLGRRLRGAPIAVIDTETTDKDPLLAHVVEIAVVGIDSLDIGAEPRVLFTSRVRPAAPIPEGATKVHGITDADVADAPTFADVWPEVVAAVEGRVPAAYNVPYDAVVLREECARAGLDVGPAAWGRWLDGLVLAKGLDQFEKGGRTLQAVAARRGIELAAHGAAGDSVATAMLLVQLVVEAIRGKQHRRAVFRAPEYPTVAAWLAWQREVALAQEREFVEYTARSGRRDPVDCPWHVLEGLEPPKPPPSVAKPAGAVAHCKTCGAAIVWAVTQGGKRMPLDPEPVRARRVEPGGLPIAAHKVTLVVEGQTLADLVRDDAGDIVGRVPHWATCTDPEKHRKPAEPPPMAANNDRAARCAGRLAVLPLAVPELARMVGVEVEHLNRALNGEVPPSCGWEPIEGRLLEALEAEVRRRVAAGQKPTEITLNPWPASDIKAAAESCEEPRG